MSTVYFDVRALVLPAGHAPAPVAGENAGSPEVRLAPEAVKALTYLAEAGHDLVLVGEGPVLLLADASLGSLAHVSRPMMPEDALGWLVTSDPEMCAGTAQRPGLRSVLLGAANSDVGLAHRAWDAEARDHLAVALMILGEEAMPSTG